MAATQRSDSRYDGHTTGTEGGWCAPCIPRGLVPVTVIRTYGLSWLYGAASRPFYAVLPTCHDNCNALMGARFVPVGGWFM